MNRELAEARKTVAVDDEIVVFLIGMTVNMWWRIWDWLPVALAMNRMIRELEANPDSGFLGHRNTSVQYWRSAEHLYRYASDRSGEHFPAWAEFYRKAARSGAVGVWHETYVVPPENVEAMYFRTKPKGLLEFCEPLPATGNRKSARQRLRALESKQSDTAAAA